jgi:hypothetical protein
MEETRSGPDGGRVSGRRPAIRSWCLAVGATAILVLTAYGATAFAADGASTLPPNWHVHDGQVALGPQHKGISFFPRILGISAEQYLQDPARCPNATDKSFLPSFGQSEGAVLRAGECQTSTVIIHVRTVPVGTAGPEGWQSLTTASEPGFVTYYVVTAL